MKGSIHFYQKSINETFEKLDASDEGLSTDQAKIRQRKYGFNQIEENKERSLLSILFDQINNPVIYLLLEAVVVSFIFNDIPEAIAIIVVILLNTLIGFWMEYQAQTSVKALKKLDTLKTRCKRDGVFSEINSNELVPGDFILLEAGNVVPADARIIFSSELKTDEAALTGESLPVDKNNKKIDREVPLAERLNMLYKGTAITRGKAHAMVTGTGHDTELGAISDMVSGTEDEEIPLNKKLGKLSTHLTWVTLSLATLFFVFGWIAGKEIYLLLQTAIAWTVAAIPEGLPIVASIALARGMVRLARQNVIVKKLAAVETLGETTVIFTDKTGTLTENKLTVQQIVTPTHTVNNENSISGNSPGNPDPFPGNSELLKDVFKISVLCNDAKLRQGDFQGDSLDVGLLNFASENNKKQFEKIRKLNRIHEDPFDSESKFMGTIHGNGDELFIAAKGAARPILNRVDYFMDENRKHEVSNAWKEEWMKKNDDLSSNGYKVIAVSFKTAPKSQSRKLKREEDFVRSMVFAGFVCFLDPAKENVSSAIEECHTAGINVVMITGDHAGTAQNVAEKVKIGKADELKVMLGRELEEKQDQITETNIFARVDPGQKYSIVEHFRKNNEITAMTGDGVNDAPALKKSNIGIAMGKKGTQIAREVSDMILKDDAFPSIVKAVEEGRIIFGNIRKFIVYQLSYHLAEIMIIASISFTLFYIPLLPLQLLFLNLLSDVFPALALGLGKGNKEVMHHPPKDPGEPIVNKSSWLKTGIYGFVMAVTITGAYLTSLYYFHDSKEMANTIAFFSLAFTQLFHVFNMRERTENFFRNQVTQNHYIWFALGICVSILAAGYFIPLIRNALELQKLAIQGWSLVAITTAVTILIIQILKQLVRKF